MRSAVQLTLNLKTVQSYLPEDFIVSPCNQEAYNYIVKWPKWHGHCSIIYGPPGSGKTHLANVWHYYNNAVTIGLGSLQDKNLYQLCAQHKAIIVEADNLGNYEELLFHLYNMTKELNTDVLILLNNNVAALNIKLPDLKSRLMACPQFKMDVPDDQMVHMLIMKYFVDYHLPVDEKNIEYIAKRVNRSYQEINDFVHGLSQYLSSHKGKVTIPNIKAYITTQLPSLQ